MIKNKTTFNFVPDHMTLLTQPGMYKAMYAFMRIVMGVAKQDIIYEKRKRWPGAQETSMTFAVKIGETAVEKSAKLGKTAIAVVQPTEPRSQGSHVRDILGNRDATVHWQHVALRTPDLLGFFDHAAKHAVNFITPIMKEEDDDLLQVFSGELYSPKSKPTGVFFEFVQREVTPALLQKLKKMDRQSWFRDKTFLGLYGEKEREYQSGKVTPIWDHELMQEFLKPWDGKELWQITEDDLEAAADTMRRYAKEKQKQVAA